MNDMPSMDLKPLDNGLQEDLRNEGAEYEVQKIVGERIENGVTEYRIRWKDWDEDHDTWEPYIHLNGCEALIERWRMKQERIREKEQAKIKNKRGPGRPPKSSHPQHQGSDSDSVGKGRKRSHSESEPHVGTTLNNKSSRISPSGNSVSSSTSSKSKAIGSDADSDIEVVSARTVSKDISRHHPDRLKFLAKLKTIPGPEVTIVNNVDAVPCPPLSFTFINDYLFREGVPVPDPNAMWGCNCKGIWGCPVKTPELCDCTELGEDNRIFAYTFGGRLRLRDNAQAAIHECNERCTCGIRCPNRVVGHGRTIKLEIFKTENKGWGLRSPEFIKAGVFVDKYVGEVIVSDEADRRMVSNDSRGLSYLFDLDKFRELAPERPIYTVDGGDFGGVTRFINHSCDPNLLIYAVTKNRSSLDIYDIALFSRRDIAAGEELTFQYTHSESEEADPDADNAAENANDNNAKNKWPCYCGADNCKGFLW